MPEPQPAGVCSASAPAVAVVDGREVLVGTTLTLEEALATLARGEQPPGLSAEQLRLLEAQALARG
jgi:hypothetical protein